MKSYTRELKVEPITALNDWIKRTIQSSLHQSQPNILMCPYMLHPSPKHAPSMQPSYAINQLQQLVSTTDFNNNNVPISEYEISLPSESKQESVITKNLKYVEWILLTAHAKSIGGCWCKFDKGAFKGWVPDTTLM